MNFQSILQNILTNPIFIIMIIGGFSALGRAMKAAQEKQAQKRELQKLRDAQRDSLRTGHQVESTQDAEIDIAGTQSTTWDQKQDLRRQRIEKLRQQRVEQLKKIRQRRSAGTSQSSPQPSSPQQSATPQSPVRTKAASQSSKQQQFKSSASQRSQASQTPPTPQQPQVTRRRRPSVIPSASAMGQRPEQAIESADINLGKTLDNNSAIEDGSIVNTTKTRTKDSKSFIVKNLRQSIIAREVLGPPIAMQTADSDTASFR